MSVNVNYCDTFLNALTNAYTAGDYVRTLGFASVGDGGAAMYKVSSDVLSDDVLSDAISCTVADTLFNYVVGNFYTSNSHFFQLVPQYGKVYAEQFGVLPDDVAFAADNIKMLNRAVAYAAQNACVLTFASKGTYYVNPSSITAKSGMHIDGNGATLHIIGDSENDEDYIELFSSSSVVNNISIRNITLVGRKTSATAGYLDQGIHIQCSNLTVKNVRFKCFEFALHTYGGSSVGTYEVQGDGEYATKTYVIPEIPNKNWLIDGCSIADTATGLMLSEIDGLTVKNSKISCITDLTDLYHCIYMASNCLNVRVTNTILCDVSGDAIHKSFAATHNVDRADISKNHFYTDLTIHNADSALDIGIISQNVMCDNVFATEVEIVLQLSGADNCIISNSNFSQTRSSKERRAFIYAEKACNCWLQNSYVYYEGRHRVTNQYQQGGFLETMFENKKHRRMFIGPEFKIPNHWFKFTGCEFKSDYPHCETYFTEGFSVALNDETYLLKTQYGEFWDNCIFETNKIVVEDEDEDKAKAKAMLILHCINDVYGGITLRNSFLTQKKVVPLHPFMFCCTPKYKENGCTVCKNCLFDENNKLLPCVRLENDVFNDFGNVDEWDKSYIYNDDGGFSSVDEAIRLSNSYFFNCYRNSGTSFVQLEE